ncbi:MAG: ABC transporter substrate-binding protein [Rhizobiales bacterium]|nr:ABC transporter substrate-binding protein [Hyphomicrobiales bacterium]
MNWQRLTQLAGAVGLLFSAGLAGAAHAETATARIAKQFGISYLPLTLMEDQKLFEKHAKQAGIDLKVEWTRFSAGSGMNEALLSGNLDFASGGVGPMLTIWGKTQNNLKVKGVAALNAMPLYLVSSNPNVKTIKDFTEKDKIALPGVKTSIQAVTLQMAAEKAFGAGQQYKLDSLTVSMGHPDALAAVLGGHSEINAHFGSAPFQDIELADPKVHKVLDSYDVLGGPHTFNSVWATTKFVEGHPKLVKAFIDALEESMSRIKSDPAAAAAIWIKAENSKLSAADAEKIIRDPKNEWTTTPKKILVYLDYMNRAGLVSAKTTNWQDVFFSGIHGANGS